MNAHISPAIIMRIKEFGESDLLVTFFTSDRGRLKGVAKGARRSKRRFANCLDLFCLTSLEYELKRKGDLHFLHSGKLINGFEGVRHDFSSLSLASYIIELTEILFPLEVADNEMFELLKNSFFAIDKGKRKNILRVHFEGKAMTFGGYGVDLDKCCNCGRTYTGEGRAVFIRSKGGIACLKCGQESELSPGLSPDTVNGLRVLQSAPWNEAEAIALTDEMVHEIKRVLKLHIEYRIGRRLKTAEYLE
jgi:DNA repair protein RecO (recombination protein O)